MVTCSRCQKREARHQVGMNIDGKLVYVALCDSCYLEVQEQSLSTASLDQFSKDLTEYAKEGKLDPVIGRDKEIDRVIHILSRRKKNNPVLIGEPGVGKTAIVEGLAQRLYDNTVPEPLRNKRLVALDLAAMIAGTAHRGSFEKRLKQSIEEVIKTKGQVILFIDEVHTLVGAGSAQGSMDAANILKPYLARGELQLIGATTVKEYRIIEKDAALERRFQQIIVDEPSHEGTVKILQGLRKNYEDHHKIQITQESIDAAVKLSSRYISDKFLPDKAIDLIDEAGASLRLEMAGQEPENLKEVIMQIDEQEKKIASENDPKKREELENQLESLKQVKKELNDLWVQTKLENVPVLTAEHVAAVISSSTGIPLSELSQDEKTKLRDLESRLKEKVVGQDSAVEVVAQSIRRARAGVKPLNRPIGVFMFLGPTGVGKTQLAKALSETLYGSEDYLIRVDMSEFGERHNVARLVGSPPGYVGFEEGGQLTDKVRRKPFSIILFDEIEKAHPEVFNILLQVMDDARLTDGHGRTVDFKNTIIIMTSNVGSSYLKQEKIGFGSIQDGVDKEKSNQAEVDEAYANISDRLNESLRSSFRPEFINRIDDVVIFKPLSKKDILSIVHLELEKLTAQLAENEIALKVTEKAEKYLAEHGYNLEMGARPIKRMIQKEIENVVSSLIIDTDMKKGDEVTVDADKNGIKVKVSADASVSVGA